jgi:hypothetical protein
MLAFEPEQPGRAYEPAALAFIGIGVLMFLLAAGGLIHVYLENAGRYVSLRMPITFPKESSGAKQVKPE